MIGQLDGDHARKELRVISNAQAEQQDSLRALPGIPRSESI